MSTIIKGDFIFNKLEDDTLSLSQYMGTDEIVKIPAEVEGIKVSLIGEDAFFDNKDIKSVYIPEGIKGIAVRAFGNCSNLTYVEVSKSVEFIGLYAFFNCSSLDNVNLLSSETKVSEFAFDHVNF